MAMLKQVLFPCVALVAIGAGLALFTSDAEDNPVDTDLDQLLSQRQLAQSDPDQFSWRVFSLISRPGNPPATGIANGHKVQVSIAQWENWAEDGALFPQNPDPAEPPRWEDRFSHGTSKHLFSNPLDAAVQASHDVRAAMQPFPQTGCVSPKCLEVRHNRHDFESIVASGLWYQEGLQQAFRAGPDQNGVPKNAKIHFGSIEIKAEWQPLTGTNDPTRYHLYRDSQGLWWKLVGLHIMTKALDKWTWSTFEQVDNPGRCDYYECKDSFGSTQPVIPQQPSGTYHVYPEEQLSSAAKQLLTSTGASQEWQYYRLKGSQIDYVVDGAPTMLGNSQIEFNVAPHTSSCITCHARARANRLGLPGRDQGYDPRPNGRIGLPGNLSPCRPMGFIWSISKAQAANSPTGPPAAPCDVN
jgi:hypothetical protein